MLQPPQPMKRSMNQKRKRSRQNRDRISDLPQPILHEILTLLPTSDAARTSLLSKAFRSTWATFPVLDLDYDKLEKVLDLHYDKLKNQIDYAHREEAKENEIKDYTHRRIHELLETGGIEKVRLRWHLTNAKQARIFFKAVNLAITNQLKEFDIGVLYRYTLPRTIVAKLISCHSITTLQLTNLHLNHISNDDFGRWPVLETLRISECLELRVFIFTSCKIRSISLESCAALKRIAVKSPSLLEFIYRGKYKISECEIDISECKSLKVLSLAKATVGNKWVDDVPRRHERLEELRLNPIESARDMNISSSMVHLRRLSVGGCFVTEDFLKEKIPKFGGLESLEILTPFDTRNIKICHPNIKRLKLSCPIRGHLSVAINARRLVSFEYNGFLLKLGSVKCKGLVDVTLTPDSVSLHMNQHSFSRLRNWIRSFGHAKLFTLGITYLESAAVPEYLRRDHFRIYDIKHLTIKTTGWLSRNRVPEKLVDSFFWLLPDLQILRFVTDVGYGRAVEFQYGHEIQMEEDITKSELISVKH